MKTRRNLADPGLVEGKGREWRKMGGKVDGKGMKNRFLLNQLQNLSKWRKKGGRWRKKGGKTAREFCPAERGLLGPMSGR